VTVVGAMKSELVNLEAKGHALITQLEEKEHELAGEFRSWFNELTGHLPAVEAEVKSDAQQVAHDAVAAEAPVAAKAMQDVAAVADAAVTGSATPVAPPAS
jgi:vacuolar-type H+-ATPase subunit D/Vma8